MNSLHQVDRRPVQLLQSITKAKNINSWSAGLNCVTLVGVLMNGCGGSKLDEWTLRTNLVYYATG